MTDTLRSLLAAATPRPWADLIGNYDDATMFITNDPISTQRPLASDMASADAALIAWLANHAEVLADVVEAVAFIRGIASGEKGDEASRTDPWNALATIVINCDQALANLEATR